MNKCVSFVLHSSARYISVAGAYLHVYACVCVLYVVGTHYRGVFVVLYMHAAHIHYGVMGYSGLHRDWMHDILCTIHSNIYLTHTDPHTGKDVEKVISSPSFMRSLDTGISYILS